MITDEDEIRRQKEEYENKSAKIRTSIRLTRQDLDSASGKAEESLRERLIRQNSSRLPDLYDNLAKNRDSILRLGPEGFFPTIQYSERNGQHILSNSPDYTDLINKYLPSLAAVAKTPNRITLANGQSQYPCLSTILSGPSKADFLIKKKSTDDLRKLQIPEVTPGGIHLCTTPI